MNKKLFLQLLIILPCMISSIFANDTSHKKSIRTHRYSQNQSQNTNKTHAAHTSKMFKKPHAQMHLQIVEDHQRNIIGAYHFEAKTKEGYRYGSFYTNMDHAPISVIENGRGTPAHLHIPGATSQLVGYITNNTYTGKLGSPKMLSLSLYNLPSQEDDAQV